MAISTSFKDVLRTFNTTYWSSINEFEQFFLQDIAERQSDTNYYTDKAGVLRIIEPINHHPILKKYEVWVSGYAATGGSSGASLWGEAMARNFAQACHIVVCKSFLEHTGRINDPSYKQYTTPGRWDYDPSRLTYWGCRFYWNEELARKCFG